MNLKLRPDQVLIIGQHPVAAALKNANRKCFGIYTSNPSNIQVAKHLTQKVDANFFKKNCPNLVHQNIAGVFSRVKQADFFHHIRDTNPENILLLDQLSDPQNIGNIMRSAAAFNFNTIILSKDRSPTETTTMLKSAVGCFELLNCFWLSGIPSIVKDLKSQDYWVYGMAGEAKSPIHKTTFPKKIILAIGSEGQGLRKIIKDNCDELLKIQSNENVESLNANNAAAIAMQYCYLRG